MRIQQIMFLHFVLVKYFILLKIFKFDLTKLKCLFSILKVVIIIYNQNTQKDVKTKLRESIRIITKKQTKSMLSLKPTNKEANSSHNIINGLEIMSNPQ